MTSSNSPTSTLEPTFRDTIYSLGQKEEKHHTMPPYQYNDKVETLNILPEEDLMEPTEVTIETKVDPLTESTTTTTIVHLPFHLTRQCSAPKVISWMRVRDPKRAKSDSRKRIRRIKKLEKQHQNQTNPGFFYSLFPFLKKKQNPEDSPKRRKVNEDQPKKNASYITLFSIQVSVLGRVHLPSSPNESQPNSGIEPKKVVSAQIDLSETTSYIIHRTFEDFEHLSEMVLRLERVLHSRQSSRRQSLQSEPDNHNTPELAALNVHHPSSGLVQALIKQFSTVKANQRAFDASATTRGFYQEGAFERVLELNEYLENVWYWLLPDHNPSGIDLTHEQQAIIHWFMPNPKSMQADGRQLKDHQETDSKWQDLQQQYGKRSSENSNPTILSKSGEHSLSSKSSSSSSSSSNEHDITNLGSISSLPSLSSPSSSSVSIASNEDTNNNNDKPENNGNKRYSATSSQNKSAPESRRTSHGTIVASPTTDSPLKGFPQDALPGSTNQIHHQEDVDMSNTQDGGRREQRDSRQSMDNYGVKRRVSLTNMIRSLTSPKDNSPRQSVIDLSPTEKNTVFPVQEICVWNTVTVKNTLHHFKPPVVA